MAPLHHHLLPLRPLRRRPRPTGRRLHPRPRRRPRLRPLPSGRLQSLRRQRHLRNRPAARPANARAPRRRPLRRPRRGRLRQRNRRPDRHGHRRHPLGLRAQAHLQHPRRARPPRRLKRVEFIWITRSIESFEWFQTLLSSLEAQSARAAETHGGPEFLRIHTYLTKKVDTDTAANIYLNTVGNTLDPLTELRTKTQYGRPDFNRLFGAMRDGLMDQSYLDVGAEHNITAQLKATVGVYVCGPSSAAREIKSACAGTSNELVRFKFWKEHF